MNDPLFRMLAALPSADPDTRRSERVRQRCRAAMAKRPPQRRQRDLTRLWSPIVALLGAAYLVEVMREAIRLTDLANRYF